MAGFMDIPREIRDEIYQLSTIAAPPLVKTAANGSVHLTQRSCFTMLCHQVRAEYEEALAKEMQNMPFYHITLDRAHNRPVAQITLPRSAIDLVITFTVDLTSATRPSPATQQHDGALRAYLHAQIRLLRGTLQGLPLLARCIVQLNIIGLPCNCPRRSWLPRRLSSLLDKIKFHILEYLDRLGVGWGSYAAYAADLSRLSLCANCRCHQDALDWDPLTGTLVAEQAVISKTGWGTYCSRSLRDCDQTQTFTIDHDLGLVRTYIPPHFIEHKTRYCKFDSTNEKHEKWAKLMEDLKVQKEESSMFTALVQSMKAVMFMLGRGCKGLWLASEYVAGLVVSWFVFLLAVIALVWLGAIPLEELTEVHGAGNA